MNVERLQMVVDAMKEGARKERVFDFSNFLRASSVSPCGFAGCALGDLALYGPAQELGWDLGVFGDARKIGVGINFKGFADVDGAEKFLEAKDPDECGWTFSTFISPGAYNRSSFYGVTRDMVIARIKAKMAEIKGMALTSNG